MAVQRVFDIELFRTCSVRSACQHLLPSEYEGNSLRGPFSYSSGFKTNKANISQNNTTPRPSFRVLLTEDRTQLVERTLEEGEGGREQLLALPEVKPQVDKVTCLKRDKGMAGIHDLIDWTLAQV